MDTEDAKRWKVFHYPWSKEKRIKFFVTGVILPMFCFGLSISGTHPNVDAPWQSGKADVYAGLLLGRFALLCFMPLLVFSMVALGGCCIRPRWAERNWVRLGIWTGLALSFQYLFLVIVAAAPFLILGPIISAAFAGGLALIVFVGAKLWPTNFQLSLAQIFWFMIVVAVGALVTQYWRARIYDIVEGGVFLCAFSAPFLTFLTFLRASVDLSNDIKARFTGWWQFVGWAISWGVAWRFAVLFMLDEYSKLPTTNPNCYVSAAAAHGHPKFVGVLNRHHRAQSKQPINLQMCRLKYLEFCIKAFSPKLHQCTRAVYDRIGPVAAILFRQNRCLADAAYLSLMPVEFFAILLQRMAKISDERIRNVYHWRGGSRGN